MSRRLGASGDNGFTLPEVLVAMVLGVILLGGTLSAFDGFTSEVSSSHRLTSAQDSARTELDSMTRTIRNARAWGSATSPVLRSSPNDFAFLTTDWPGTGSTPGTHVVRYCVDTTQHSLWFEGQRNASSVPAVPASCPSTGAQWTRSQLISGHAANTSADPLFSYAGSPVGSIGMTLRVDGGSRPRARVTALRTAASIRSVVGQSPALTASDITVTCQPDKSALLALGTSFDASGSPLTASYATAGGIPVGSGKVTLGSSAQGNIKVTVTNALGLQQVLFRQVSCP